MLISSVLAAEKTAKTPGKKAPDLVVTKATVTRPAKGSKKVVVTYTVKNQGEVISGPSITAIVPSAGGKTGQQYTPPLKPGGVYTTTWTHDLAREGNLQFKVSADYFNKVPESNEGNNENVVRFGFGRKI